jgi:hypothetical protein
MRIYGDTVVFRSKPEMYRYEAGQTKNYTIRLVDVKEYQALSNPLITKIRIEDTAQPDEKNFTRKIVGIFYHAHVLGKDLISITWEQRQANQRGARK